MDRLRLIEVLGERLNWYIGNTWPSSDPIEYGRHAEQWSKTLYLLRTLYESIEDSDKKDPRYISIRDRFSDAWDISGPPSYEESFSYGL